MIGVLTQLSIIGLLNRNERAEDRESMKEGVPDS